MISHRQIIENRWNHGGDGSSEWALREIDRLTTENSQLKQYKAIVMRFVDRLSDPAECDLLHDIAAEFTGAVNQIVSGNQTTNELPASTKIGSDDSQQCANCDGSGWIRLTLGRHKPCHVCGGKA